MTDTETETCANCSNSIGYHSAHIVLLCTLKHPNPIVTDVWYSKKVSPEYYCDAYEERGKTMNTDSKEVVR